jgi:ATP synthase protein I
MPKDDSMRQVGKYLGIGFILPTCVFVGWLIGYFLDRALHTKFLTLVFLLLGIAAGFVSLIRELNQDNDSK